MVYEDEKHIFLRNQAKERYHKRYKLQRKILYLCRKLDIDRKLFMAECNNDIETAFIKIKNIDLQRQIH